MPYQGTLSLLPWVLEPWQAHARRLGLGREELWQHISGWSRCWETSFCDAEVVFRGIWVYFGSCSLFSRLKLFFCFFWVDNMQRLKRWRHPVGLWRCICWMTWRYICCKATSSYTTRWLALQNVGQVTILGMMMMMMIFGESSNPNKIHWFSTKLQNLMFLQWISECW